MAEFWAYVVSKQDQILERLGQHLSMVMTALLFSVIIGVLVGYLITYNKKAASITLSICSAMMTIPSLALFTLFIPLFGVGSTSATVGLVIYTLLPIVRNVYVGLTQIDPAIIDSALGMGMKGYRLTVKVKIPLALPVVFAGIRTSAVLGIGLGAIATYIGAHGLGEFIFQGINRGNRNMILTGAILITLIALIVDLIMQLFQKIAERNVR